ncbi:dickkopf-related protein 3 [Hyla sarda]|uniref:dickkopf-related protein 3 n=1 Tax=Hyla sarda TaxID=327740 RepID=UPI0024C34CAA|nr:dickkopf-related protein 3 [Hyla sarda]XP_056383971.1 dickkopf-related protein 3 [Hyla sarda]XP_056383972.1 dickkopf-related protein 3 [Hyla sarda]
MLLVVLAVTLGLVVSSPIPNTTTPAAPGAHIADAPVKSSLNEMFEEVEELIGDTQSKLENAVKELQTEESLKDHVSLTDLPPNYHNKTVKETKVGNATIVTKEEIIKETDNKTGSTYISKTIISTLKDGDKMGHDCIVDEDCGTGNYCNLSGVNYKCQPCQEEATCIRDGECCEGRLCVWGQCRTSSKGQSGTICENQQDCGPGLCCAVHTVLLFPVCTPAPGRGEPCQTLNPLLELFPWELDSEVPVSHCPCPSGLVCQPESHGLVSVCEEPSLLDTKRDPAGTTEEDWSLVTPAPRDDIVYEDDLIAPTGFGFDLGASEDVIDRESELVPQPQFVDLI